MSADVDASMEDAGRPKNDTEHNADRKVRFEDNTDNEDTDVDGDWVLFSTSKLWSH